MSNLMAHAERELKAAGYSLESEDVMDRRIYKHTMLIVQQFALCGHSGASAAMHTDMITKLLQFQPLGPITRDVHEWEPVGELYPGMSEDMIWQNRRDGRMFSEDGGRTYYNVDELRRGWRARLFGRVRRRYESLQAEGF